MWTWKSKTKRCAAPTARLVPNSPAQTQISQAFKEENPFERAARELVKVDIKSTLPLSDNTWQMEWIETITDRQGNVLDTPRFKATITTQTVQPKKQSGDEPKPAWPLDCHLQRRTN
ncbi:type IV secretion system protein [Vibrio parahaemolyticus]|uniref:type IV secretion system protein n=1 Tax=Vibrio parahaemolyticus TaxID=670 RepID=UPI001F0EE021|nr:type IV secretion system protein [Vibrio parahaemolyticus]